LLTKLLTVNKRIVKLDSNDLEEVHDETVDIANKSHFPFVNKTCVITREAKYKVAKAIVTSLECSAEVVQVQDKTITFKLERLTNNIFSYSGLQGKISIYSMKKDIYSTIVASLCAEEKSLFSSIQRKNSEMASIVGKNFPNIESLQNLIIEFSSSTLILEHFITLLDEYKSYNDSEVTSKLKFITMACEVFQVKPITL